MKLINSFWYRGIKYGNFRAESGEFETVVLEVSERQAQKELNKAIKQPKALKTFDFSTEWNKLINKK